MSRGARYPEMLTLVAHDYDTGEVLCVARSYAECMEALGVRTRATIENYSTPSRARELARGRHLTKKRRVIVDRIYDEDWEDEDERD